MSSTCPPIQMGHTYARYLVRMEEMRQSVRIAQQALDNMPPGPVRSDNRQVRPPAACRAGHQHGGGDPTTSSYGPEGFEVPRGAVYVAVESRVENRRLPGE